MSLYEKIKSMSLDEMAILFYGVHNEKNLASLRILYDSGLHIDIEHIALIDTTIYKYIKWLESEFKET